MDIKNDSDKFVDCPICGKEFSSNSIENHVDKCLFLNETNPKSEGSLKRIMPFSATDNSVIKKSKSLTNRQNRMTKSASLSPNLKSTNKKFSDKPVFLNVNSLPSQKEQLKKSPIIEDNENVVTTQMQFESNKSIKIIPLAEKMRPNSILSYVGQSHILGPETVLYKLLIKNEIPNVIFWGPPGCGKTSLANIIGNICKTSAGKYRFVKLSAAMSGVNDVKEAISVARNDTKFGRKTVMFMDEIHRFNKLQQDIFLPHVESGTITLIGATTENPSFSLNSALLSRCRVLVLEKLSIENVYAILEKSVISLNGLIISQQEELDTLSSSKYSFIIDKQTIQWLAETSDGDARIALGGLELAINSKELSEKESLSQGVNVISLDDIKDSLKKTHMLYDKKGDQHYDLISALHKSLRASDENASLYWLTRMLAGGEDPIYVSRRLVRFASEDVGLEDPKALGLAVQTMQGCKMLGMPECDVLLAQCVIYLARAPKSRLMEDALRSAQRFIANFKGPQPSVPLHLRNAPTKLMSNLGYGKGYNMLHKDKSNLNYLPEGIEDVNFFV